MFNSTVFDVAFALIFMYLMLSLVSSAAKELLEAYLKKRAIDLEAAIRELLNDPEGKGLTKQVYEHPLILSLFAAAAYGMPRSGTYSALDSEAAKVKKYWG